jgi:hypothetical protein
MILETYVAKNPCGFKSYERRETVAPMRGMLRCSDAPTYAYGIVGGRIRLA